MGMRFLRNRLAGEAQRGQTAFSSKIPRTAGLLAGSFVVAAGAGGADGGFKVFYLDLVGFGWIWSCWACPNLMNRGFRGLRMTMSMSMRRMDMDIVQFDRCNRLIWPLLSIAWAMIILFKENSH